MQTEKDKQITFTSLGQSSIPKSTSESFIFNEKDVGSSMGVLFCGIIIWISREYRTDMAKAVGTC